MSIDQNFDGNHPLQYNQHGICSSKLEFDQLPGEISNGNSKLNFEADDNA